jgi:imidazolonepropionase-like amidohydrolase
MIQAGAVSDLVLLDANPLEDITNTQAIEAVMIGETYLPKETIDAMLQKLVKH